MKLNIKFFIVGTMLAVLLPVVAIAQTPAADACTAEAKAALYTKFLANRQGPTEANKSGDQEVAFNTAREYKTLCPADDSEPAKYMASWSGKYEAASRKSKFLTAYDKKSYAEMLTLGRQVLADDPNYNRAYILLGIVGYVASSTGNHSLNAESLPYAKKAIELLEAGKTPDDWKPYTGKDDALAWLNYSIGHALKDSPAEALPYMLKAARYQSLLKTNPLTFSGYRRRHTSWGFMPGRRRPISSMPTKTKVPNNSSLCKTFIRPLTASLMLTRGQLLWPVQTPSFSSQDDVDADRD